MCKDSTFSFKDNIWWREVRGFSRRKVDEMCFKLFSFQYKAFFDLHHHSPSWFTYPFLFICLRFCQNLTNPTYLQVVVFKHLLIIFMENNECPEDIMKAGTLTPWLQGSFLNVSPPSVYKWRDLIVIEYSPHNIAVKFNVKLT